MRTTLLLVSSLLSIVTSGQISGSSIFLQGQFVEVGINGCGVYGSHEEPPVGPFGEYHIPNANGLGYVADSEMDGWEVHTDPDAPDFCGDYFTPVSPEEGWAIQYGDSVYENHSTYCTGYGGFPYVDTIADIPGSNTIYSDSAGLQTAVWEGWLVDDDLDLSLKQITTLADTSLYFISTIEITNNGATDLTDLYYIRNVDPDQDFDHCGIYATYNSILSNTPASDTVLLTAIGGSCGCYFGTTAVDPRARVSFGYFYLSPNKPSDAYYGLGDYPYHLDGEDVFVDCAVQITYKFDLPSGATTSLSYARLFGESAVESAQQALNELNEPVITSNVDVLPPTISLFPNPVSDQLNLELADWVTNAIIEVVTVNGGEVMLNQSVQEQLSTFDVSTWHPGVYLVKVCTAAGCFGQTILVQ